MDLSAKIPIVLESSTVPPEILMNGDMSPSAISFEGPYPQTPLDVFLLKLLILAFEIL
jgi:hypothetical protein